MRFRRIVIAQFIVVSLLLYTLVVYIMYKYQKLKTQPTLLNTVESEYPATLPMPGLLICTDSINLKTNITSGPQWPQKNTNFSMSETKLFIEGVSNLCWTINTTDPIVYPHQRTDNYFLPSWDNLNINITYIGSNNNILSDPSSYQLSLFNPLENPDILNLPWINTGSLNQVRISYSIEKRTYLNKTSKILFKNQLVTETYVPNGINSIDVRADPFLIMRTEEYQSITVFSVATDVLTFATSVLLTTYFILFGKGKFYPWGVMHFLLREKPEYTKVDGYQDTLMNVVVTYLDVEDIRSKDEKIDSTIKATT